MTSARDHNGRPQQHDEFRVTWRGYDRDEVRKLVRGLREALQAVTADRDAAAEYVRFQSRELAGLRDENQKLRQRLDRVCRTPVETDGLSERLWHMVDLAQREAREVLADAHAEADRRRAALDKREAELEARRAELESQHRETVRQFKAEAAAEAERAENARREADERATRRRQELERDFAKSLAVRRDEMNRALARREEAAKAEAERIVAEATARAEHIVADATARVRTLEAARRKAASELRTAREALAGALPLIEPLPDEVAADRTGSSIGVVPQAPVPLESRVPGELPAPSAGSGQRSAAPHPRVVRAERPVRRVVGPTVSSVR
ncbi:hypothetical protein [Saccharomonospora xinjiangensis]|uniref:DivIVA protein n=1 Tax=Saccharomonospora xinjiangensis XJ-54 TaxID=882086 RepID=I0V6F5_9PSEU|nr:hypothetical protein SacxiDRAFT_3509 [Saccharomonospora xinjiangensis XJ-54]